MDNGLSLADVMALRGTDDGMNGNWFWILILFLFGFNNGGFGFGNGNGAAAQGMLTRAELDDGFNFNQLDNGIRGLERGQCQLGYDSLNQTRETQNAIAQLGYQTQQCCCETNRNIDSVRAENYKNTCEIKTAIHEEGEATRALINANVMQELRDQLQAAQLQLGNVTQTQNLINILRPYPTPSYITCSPYVSMTTQGNYNCGGCC